MQKRAFCGAVLFLIATLACGTSSTPPAQQIWQTPGLQETLAAGPDSSTTAESHCQPDQWKLVVTSVAVKPEGNGWKTVSVQIAAVNNSDHWGGIEAPYIFNNDVKLTTEANYTYYPQGAGGGVVYDIPPGLSAVGSQASLTTQYSGYGFKVAESQNSFTLDISDATILCDGFRDPMPPTHVILGNGTRIPYPAEDVSQFPDLINQKIELPGKGILIFTNASRGKNNITLSFSFSNSSGGYNTSGAIAAYIEGDDGVQRYASGGFQAGPGQTIQGQLTSSVPNDVNNLLLVWEDIGKVFRINP